VHKLYLHIARLMVHKQLVDCYTGENIQLQNKLNRYTVGPAQK